MTSSLRPRRLARAFVYSRRRARRRLSSLDSGGLLVKALVDAPLHSMDVGAAGGLSDHWREYLPFMDVDCFEPDHAECSALQRTSPTNVHWFPVALAGATGQRQFYVLNRATGSSLLPPNDAVLREYAGYSYAGVRRVATVDCLALSDFLHMYQRPTPLLLKLDTQGSELEILSSLSPVQLGEILCVEIEVEFLELYKDQPTFVDVHAFMQQHGFRLLDLRTHRSYRCAGDRPNHYLRKYLRTASGSAALSAELVAGDALYLRDPLFQDDAWSRTALMRYLFILRMYRFFDLALWLIEQAASARTITADERGALLREAVRGAPRPALRQRVGIIGYVTRQFLKALAHDDQEVFWTRRSWPDQ